MTDQLPTTDADTIVAHLRTLNTADAGSAHLDAQHLDRAGLLAVAAASGLTRVDQLSQPALRDRIIKQTITARRKFAGLRSW